MKGITLLSALLVYSTILSKVVNASDDVRSEVKEPNENLTVPEKWQIIENKVKEIANSGVKMLLPILMENSAKLNLSRECMKNGLYLLSGVKNIQPWAIQFLDSSAKTIDGLMEATMSSFGDYDECLDAEVKSTKLRDKQKLLFRGQYCTIELVPPLPPKPSPFKLDEVLDELKNISKKDTLMGEISKQAQIFYDTPLTLGICVPSGCSIEDIDKIARALGNTLLFTAKASRCEVKEENNFTPLIIAVITCYSFVGFLVLFGSLLDLYDYYRKIGYKNKFIRVLVAFSLFTNFRKFVDTETSSGTLTCLNGVRFLSMTWILSGHTYLNINYHHFLGFKKMRNNVNDFAFQAVINGTYAVDTFFFIGALLVSYGILKLKRGQGHNFNVVLYIFHRLWRILPVYAFVIMFMFLLNLMGSGPLWHEMTHKYIKACYKNWWASLIFINNFYDGENACVPHSWYLAADFQLYIAALIIILPMLRRPKIAIILGVIGIIASVIYSGVATYVNKYPYAAVDVNLSRGELISYLAQFYFKPFTHASPYCIGLLAGYLLATKPDIKIPPLIQVAGWSFAFICCFSVLYGEVEWVRGSEPSFWTGMMYATFSRTAWTVGVAWMIICCSTGHGGIINYILSWKAFIPLGRLTFLAYLVHFPLQLVFNGSIRTHMQTQYFFHVWIFLGHVCVTYGIAFAGSMLIEAPFLALEKILLTREKKTENNALSFRSASFRSEKNNDTNGIIPKTADESGGIENSCTLYNLK